MLSATQQLVVDDWKCLWKILFLNIAENFYLHTYFIFYDFSIKFPWYYGAIQAHCFSVIVVTKLNYLHVLSLILLFPSIILMHVQHLIWLKSLYLGHECAYWNICIFKTWDQKALHKRQGVKKNKAKDPRNKQKHLLSVEFQTSVSREEWGWFLSFKNSKFMPCGKYPASLSG